MTRRRRPVGHPSTVTNSAYFAEIKACIESGWPAPAIIAHLKQIGAPADQIPAERALTRWRAKHLPSAVVLPHKVIADKLKGVDYKVDVLRTLSRLVPLMEDRVAAGIEAEGKMMGGLPSEATDKAAATLLAFLRDLRQVQQDLGLLPSKPNGPLVLNGQGGKVLVLESSEDLRDLLELEALEKKQLVEGQAVDAPAQIVRQAEETSVQAGGAAADRVSS